MCGTQRRTARTCPPPPRRQSRTAGGSSAPPRNPRRTRHPTRARRRRGKRCNSSSSDRHRRYSSHHKARRRCPPHRAQRSPAGRTPRTRPARIVPRRGRGGWSWSTPCSRLSPPWRKPRTSHRTLSTSSPRPRQRQRCRRRSSPGTRSPTGRAWRSPRRRRGSPTRCRRRRSRNWTRKAGTGARLRTARAACTSRRTCPPN